MIVVRGRAYCSYCDNVIGVITLFSVVVVKGELTVFTVVEVIGEVTVVADIVVIGGAYSSYCGSDERGA